MHRSQQARRRSPGFKSRSRGAALACAIDVLECRRLFSGETAAAIPAFVANTTSPAADAITLDKYFTDADLPGTLVTFKTNLGTITVSLTDAATPQTVANFLSYVSKGAYTDTIFHRSVVLSTGAGGTPTAPSDIIQGGGYVVKGRSFAHIPTQAPVDDEYTTELYGDVTGTLAMAKTSAANSATSEWYFNVHDNTTLDTPTNSSTGVMTSYTVFGKVITGMNIVDEIAALPAYNVSSSLGLTDVPVTGLTAGEATKMFPITTNNLVYTQSVTSQPGVNYTVTSDNNALVTPKVSDGVLSFAYPSGLSGTADITVVAKSLDGTSASTTFTVTVPNSATPTAGPVAANISAPSVVTGTTTTISVLGSDTDSVSPFNVSSLTITTAPAHGTATVNTSTGLITYTPAAGYTGVDSLSYTIADAAGTVSNAATVSLDVVPAPVSVTIGTAGARSLTFTQPSGVVGHLFVSGGTAQITFAGSQVTSSTAGGVITASGASATIASIVINNSGAAASLTLTASGAVSLGSITDSGAVSVLDLPNATLTGSSSFKSINRLIAAGAANSTLSLGSGSSTALIIPTVTNTTVTSTGAIASITSTQWLNSDGGYYSINTPRIGRLKVTGSFAEVLNLTGTGSSLAVSSVGQASAAWTVAGAIGTATFGSPASTWSLAENGAIGSLVIAGNLASDISAASIGSLTVSGTTTGAVVDATSSKSERMKFAGAIATTNISSGGRITSITAPSLSSTQISAGTIGLLAVSGTATGATISTTAVASNKVDIASVRIGGAVSTSSVTSSGRISSLTAASLASSQVTGGTLGSLVVPGGWNTATIRTTAAATNKLQIDQLRMGATVSSSISSAGSIGNINAASLDSTQIASATIGSITVSGATTTATIQTSAGFSKKALEIGRLRFGGAVTTTSIISVGNIGSIVAASLTGSHIYAGVTSTISQALSLPSTTSDFAANARIASVVLGKATTAFSNTLISAETIGDLHLGNVASSNSGTPEGVAAHTLSSVVATLVPGGVIDAGPAELKSATTLAAYETAKKLALGDFVIKLI